MRQTPKRGGEVFWPMIVLKKWLNIRANNSEFSADEGGIDSELDDDEEYCGCEGKQQRSNRSGLEAVTNDGVSACDRVLSFGKGLKLLKYKRSELKLSDHRPVTAIFMAEVEVFSHRKLQKALTLTDAEIEDGHTVPHLDFNLEMDDQGLQTSYLVL